jgi:SAM-dependent methyltransferase
VRKENIQRLRSVDIPTDDLHYIHYYFYHQDLFYCFNKYAVGELLDIGCGNKPYKALIEQKVNKYIGCDIIQSSENCVDIICDAANIPLPADQFDTIICTQTIEHVEQHQLLINEAFRLLKPGGKFILSGPMYWPLHEEPYDFFRFTKYGFGYILRKAGFEILEQKSNGGKWSLCGQVIIQTIYPQLNKRRTFKWKILRFIVNKIFGGIKGINKFFITMDVREKDEKNTMNYVFVATK